MELSHSEGNHYAECDEPLVSIRRSSVTLEDEVDTRAVDRAVLDNLFRSFHTLKGISGMVGLAAAEQLAHHLESYLRRLREGTVVLSKSGFEALVAGVSRLEGVLSLSAMTAGEKIVIKIADDDEIVIIAADPARRFAETRDLHAACLRSL